MLLADSSAIERLVKRDNLLNSLHSVSAGVAVLNQPRETHTKSTFTDVRFRRPGQYVVVTRAAAIPHVLTPERVERNFVSVVRVHDAHQRSRRLFYAGHVGMQQRHQLHHVLLVAGLLARSHDVEGETH